MIRSGPRAFPAFLLAALAVLFSVLWAMPWSAHAQTVPTLQVEDVSALEGTARLKFKVTLADGARATEVVTVDYATADGEALTGNDYAGTSGTVTISYGESFGFIFVALHDDRVPEFDETFTLTLSNPSNAALPGGASSVAVTGTIIDNEGPYLTIKASSLTSSQECRQSSKPPGPAPPRKLFQSLLKYATCTPTAALSHLLMGKRVRLLCLIFLSRRARGKSSGSLSR